MKLLKVTLFHKLLILLTGCVMCFVSCENNPENNQVITSDATSEMDTESYTLFWEFIGEFTEEQKAKLKTWIKEVYEATKVTLGVYPFDVYVSFEATNSNGSSPVPFGLASRRDHKNKVHFYVNPAAHLEDLLSDWTAPHELSHLAIPFLGSNSKWFSEGFATFLSRQIMMEMGHYTQEEFDSLYHSRIVDSKRYYNSGTKTFLEVSDSLMSVHIYGSMYWGSTSFFQTIDKKLRDEKNMRFIEVIQEYQNCCRFQDRNLKEVIRTFDSIIGESWCRDLMANYRTQSSASVLSDY